VYSNLNLLPTGASFVISYPSQITVAVTSCYVTSGSVYTMSCTLDSTNKIIYMSGTSGWTQNIVLGSTISISFGPVTNPAS
jgi:predicted Zn-dependent protease